MDTPSQSNKNNELDPHVASLLKSILEKKDVALVTATERIFLKARRSYLNDDQRKRFASIIGITVDEELDAEESTAQEMTYEEIYAKAVALGYKGRREKKPVLLAFIEQNQPKE